MVLPAVWSVSSGGDPPPGTEGRAVPLTSPASRAHHGTAAVALAPPPATSHKSYQGNAASCVLRVDALGASALLTGDIPKQVEYRLLGRVAPATVLQLAHHGSDSSSSTAWLRAVSPRWAVASMGYANRFDHPDPDVVERLEAAGVTLLRTDRTGMIVFRLGGPDNAALITKWRRAHGRPWHREPEL